jgi:poly-gamma-glutamate capsule biosynthesis protein CapA/YwtB (metallophosphatase superfamily)
MLELLNDGRILHSGAGMNLNEATIPAILKVGRNKVAVVSSKDNQPEGEALPDWPGINYIPLSLNEHYAERMEYCIRNAGENADIVIASSHVGLHFRESSSSEYVNFAHRLLDLDADIYGGHSNHSHKALKFTMANQYSMTPVT